MEDRGRPHNTTGTQLFAKDCLFVRFHIVNKTQSTAEFGSRLGGGPAVTAQPVGRLKVWHLILRTVWGSQQKVMTYCCSLVGPCVEKQFCSVVLCTHPGVSVSVVEVSAGEMV